MRDPIVCHCKMCRKFHGDAVAYTTAPMEGLNFIKDDGLTWYQSSDIAKRGFCKTCGASMFFFELNRPQTMSITAGCLEEPTGIRSASHIFVGSKGDYYDIHDDLPKYEEE
nr:GFA family protein [Sneathiella limimaris]